MARKNIKYNDLLKLAESYGVDNNAMFLSCIEQYETQLQIIRMIRDALENDDRAVVTKEYVKGRENLQANPLILQLPKHIDSANRTLSTMLDIIERLGHPAV